MVITNIGTGTARNAVFTDVVDVNTTVVAGSVKTDRGQVTAGQQGGARVQIAIGDIAPGGAVSITYRTTINRNVPAGTRSIRNQGLVSAVGVAGVATDDPSTGPGGDPTLISVVGTTRLRIAKFGPARVSKGARTLYSIRVTNRGGSTAAGLVVTDRLPAGMVVVGRPRNTTVRGRTVTWRIPSLAPGRSVVLTLPVRVVGRIGTRVTNTATVRASNAAPVSARARTLIIAFVPPRPTG